MHRAVKLALGTTVLVVPSAILGPTVPVLSAAAITPVFNSGDFGKSTQIDNPYFPLSPGTTFVY